MRLTGQQKKILKEGILGAYPNQDELEVLLSEKMDLQWSAIARGQDYTSKIANLVKQLEADGRVEQLIKVIVEQKPNSPYLTQFKTGFGDILTKPPPSNLQYSGSDHFVGRDEVLEEIGKRLKQDSQLAICAVSGMGGIGKTELAVKYALGNKNKYLGGICWLECRAGDLGTQIVNYARSPLELNIPEGLELPEQVSYCWRNWGQGTVLLVYDDVVDYQEIVPYLPPRDYPRFKVLLTSRQRLLDPSKRIELGVLDEEAALELLQALVRDGRIQAQLEQSKALCAWLGYLPLGLELVGRYLEKNTSVDIAKVQKRLEKAKLEAPAFDIPEGADITGKRNLAAAFQLSWEDEKLTKEARELGCRLSLFATASINWSLVEACYLGEQVQLMENIGRMKANPDKEAYQAYLQQQLISSKEQGEEIEDIEEVEEKLENWLSEMDEGKQTLETLRVQLCDRSLLQEITQDDYRLHPLIHEFLQTKQGEIENIDDCKRDLCRVMVAIAKQIPSTVTLEVIESTTSYIPHLREVGENLTKWVEDEVLTWPFVGLGRIYEGQSQFTEAEKWRKKSVKAGRDRLGERHPYVAQSYNNLAVLYCAMGRYEKALPLYQNALEISLEQLGERHPSVATSYNNLAALYESMGRYEEALPLHQNALEIRLEQLGERHPDVATSYNNLAGLYESMGRYEEALPLYQNALEIRLEQLGERHPDVATSYNNLAGLYESMGRYEEALPLYQNALEIRLEQLGERHPDVATTYNDLAYLYKSMGRDEEALPLYQNALEIRLEQLGERHPSVATTYNNLAGLYLAMGRYEEAIAHYQKAINIAQQTLGENHPNTVTTTNNYLQMLLQAPTEEILKALPEEIHENYLQWRSDQEKQKG